MHYGLIGKPLGHSFSERYFNDRFRAEGLEHSYKLYELGSMDELRPLLDADPKLVGLNVTIPYKMEAAQLAEYWDASVYRTKAANLLLRMPDESFAAFNTDVYGFMTALKAWMEELGLGLPKKSLVIGTGGGSRGVQGALQKLKLDFSVVGRKEGMDLNERPYLHYDELPGRMGEFTLLVNCTPLGMHPDVGTAPPLPYDELRPGQLAYDIVYNPAETLFMQRCGAQGCKVKDGLSMLYAQAEENYRLFKKYNQ